MCVTYMCVCMVRVLGCTVASDCVCVCVRVRDVSTCVVCVC